MTASNEKFPWEEGAEAPATSAATATDAAPSKAKKGKAAAKPADAPPAATDDASETENAGDDGSDGGEVSPFRGMDDETAASLQFPVFPDLDALLADRAQFDVQVEEAIGEEGENIGRTGLETRAEVASLTWLHYQRRILVRGMAPLARLFDGKPKNADAKRKQHRQVIGTLIQREQRIEGEKIESKLERLANGDARHIAFCRHMDALEDKYYEARNAFLELGDLIRDREIGLQSYNSELRSGIRTDAGQV